MKVRALNLGLAASLALSCAAACGDATTDLPTTEEPAASYGLEMTYTLPKLGDVKRVKFTIIQLETHCSGPGKKGHDGYDDGKTWYDCVIAPFSVYADINVKNYPRDFDFFRDDSVFDADSVHYGADRYVVLPPGKYKIIAEPLNKHDKPSEFCDSAHFKGAKVVDGETTHVELISQCLGEEQGGLNTTVAFNHPPHLHVEYPDDDKFVSTCEVATVCATATDANGDPLEIEWEQTGGPEISDGHLSIEEVDRTRHEDGSLSVTECLRFLPDAADTFKWEVRTYDLLADGTRIEDYLQTSYGDKGHAPTGRTSHDDYTFVISSAVACNIE